VARGRRGGRRTHCASSRGTRPRRSQASRLRVRARAAEARCQLSDGEALAKEGESLRVPSPSVASPATILCQAGELRAERR
jgi:hypothetical protein